jgi:hypothetical protein
MYYNSILNLLSSILIFYFIDKCLLYLGDNNSKRRWYLIHALANTYVVVYGFNNIINCFKDPFSIINKNFTNTLLLDFVIGLHLYHIFTSFNNLRIVDWIHHLVSCILVGYSSLLIGNTYLVNYILFFLCGLPGGIDYYLLTLEKYNIINKIVEKRINVYLNICIRLPGILFALFMTYLNYIYNINDKYSYCDHIIVIIIMNFNLINAIYFTIDVCINYGYNLRVLEDAIL